MVEFEHLSSSNTHARVMWKLQGYAGVEESILVKAWMEQITISAQSSVRELK